MSAETEIYLDHARKLRLRAGQIGALRQPIDPAQPGRSNDEELETAASALEDAAEHLSRQAEQLLAANRSVDTFMANLSHELRTPLTPALLIISALQTEPSLSEDVRADLALVREQIDLEVRLVDNLLDTTRLSHGKLTLRAEPLDLHLVLTAVVESVRRGGEESATLFLELTATRNWVRADAARLGQIFFNLIQNGLKFTPMTGSVMVRTRDQADSIAIDVIDTGRGFDPQVLPRLFEAFEQEEATLARTFGGLGLGLSIAKGLAELHGGRLTGHSAGADKGSTFTLTLPAIVPPPAPSAPALLPPAVSAGTVSSPTAPLRAASDPMPGILLVEDHNQSLQLTARLLSAFGYTVKTATHFQSAAQLLEANHFDLLLCDIELPDGTGWDLMRLARSRGATKGLALSGSAAEEDIRRSREAGFEMHLVKPVTVQKLTQAIEQVFSRKGTNGS